ncbi:MAG TPA: M48 family metalloprotease [Bacteroidales bacterium]|nr:M48 family metalloprotease [Bacteroidales bacterium]
MKFSFILFKFFIVLVVLLTPSCSRNPVTGRREFMFISERREMVIGAEYDRHMVELFGLYEDADMLAFINEKGRQMGLVSHRPALEYQFRILDSPVINAFAVPGGYIYLTRGILAHFNSEAELIGVIGHEMGHITARHALSRQSRGQLAQLLLLGGMIVSEEFAQFANLAYTGLELLFLQYSRSDEREADRLGVEYSARIGYDASQFADFFNLLVRMELEGRTGGIPTFLSTHPDPGDRYNSVNQQAQEWKQTLGGDTWLVNQENYLRMINGMVYGEDPRQGYQDDQRFFHPNQRFTFPIPTGWNVEITPGQVRLTPARGNALMMLSKVEGASLRQVAQSNIEQMGLRPLESENITINGLQAMAFVSDQAQAQVESGQAIKVRSVFIEHNEQFYAFHGLAATQEFDSFLPHFQHAMLNFSRLTDHSRINVRPQRIRVRQAPVSGSLRVVLQALDVRPDQLEELAFLNNMELNDRVNAGRLIKTITR